MNLRARFGVQRGCEDNFAVAADRARKVSVGGGRAGFEEDDIKDDHSRLVGGHAIDQLRMEFPIPVGDARLSECLERVVVEVNDHEFAGNLARRKSTREKQVVSEENEFVAEGESDEPKRQAKRSSVGRASMRRAEFIPPLLHVRCGARLGGPDTRRQEEVQSATGHGGETVARS